VGGHNLKLTGKLESDSDSESESGDSGDDEWIVKKQRTNAQGVRRSSRLVSGHNAPVVQLLAAVYFWGVE